MIFASDSAFIFLH